MLNLIYSQKMGVRQMANSNDYKQLDVNYTFSLAQISHEIRNPLTLINSTIQLLAHKHPTLAADDLWIQLVKDIDYLKDLTASLSRLNSGAAPSFISIDISSFLSELLEPYQAVLKASGKSLTVHLQEDLPSLICDPINIKQCLINLIKNSIEATNVGDTIEITVKSRPNRMIITISDTGHGISEERLETIFEPFTSYKENGSGLGLSIAQKIVSAHKGIIRVYSKINIGTKFIMILPLEQ